MSGRFFRTAAVASVFMGTVIGAGFASGQEVYQFFSRYGSLGTAGIVVSSVALGLLGALVMNWGQQYSSTSHRSFFLATVGRTIGCWGDYVITLFLLVFSGVMLAGAGALTREMGWTWNGGVFFTGILAGIILSFKMQGIRSFNLLVIPLLLGTGVVIGAAGMGLPPVQPKTIGTQGWLTSALTYTSYNLVLSIPVLSSVHRIEKDPSILRWGGWIGGLGLGISALLFHLALTRSRGLLEGTELPLLPIIAVFGPIAQRIYAAVLWGELFTTYIASIYGLVQRWGEVYSKNYLPRLALVIIISALISRVGFSRLIRSAYPLCGWISLGIILVMLYRNLSFFRNLQKKTVINKS